VSTRCRTCPPIRATATGTSPFAFTGNRFEFRAPGSGQTVAVPMVMINTIMADSLDYIATVLEQAVAAGEDFDKAVQQLLTDIITSTARWCSTGTVSEDWQTEAAAAGCPTQHQLRLHDVSAFRARRAAVVSPGR